MELSDFAVKASQLETVSLLWLSVVLPIGCNNTGMVTISQDPGHMTFAPMEWRRMQRGIATHRSDSQLSGR